MTKFTPAMRLSQLTLPTAVAVPRPSRVARVLGRLLAPVDVASLVVFRIAFGAIACWWAVDYMVRGRLQSAYIDPQFHFTFYGFDWVRPWPGGGMYLYFIALAVAGAAIASGFFYRWAALFFAVGLTHVFLLDRTNYQNHYYLLVLTGWLLVLLPLNRDWSVDVLEGTTVRAQTVPTWMLWLARFHIALPYVFGGLAKFEADWFAGAPLRQTLASHATWPVVGPWLLDERVVQGFIWGGLLLDLGIVPLLMWRPTRRLAYLASVVFHILNSQLFSIHIFPWFMLAATTLFFEPDWPRRMFRLLPANGTRLVTRSVSEGVKNQRFRWQSLADASGYDHMRSNRVSAIGLPAPGSPPVPVAWRSLSHRARLSILMLCAYCLFHCVWPLRHHLYPGPASWTEQGHYFAWRMMLRGKTVGIRYYLTDAESGRTQLVDPRSILSPLQLGAFPRDPEMILHLAHHIRDEYRRQFGREAEVRALVLTSLNGRKPQLQIDPNVDLSKEPRGFHHRSWIMPLKEPLRAVAWSVPIMEWEQHVSLPPMPFLQRGNRSPTDSTEAHFERETSSKPQATTAMGSGPA